MVFAQLRTRLPTSIGAFDDRASSRLRTIHRTSRPIAPAAHLTVDWTQLQVAGGHFFQDTAFSTIGDGLDYNLSLLELFASAALLAASGPISPIAQLAVHGAIVSVAFFGVEKLRALFTVSLGSRRDNTTAFFFSSSTLSRAQGPFAPVGHFAINVAHSVSAKARSSCASDTSTTAQAGIHAFFLGSAATLLVGIGRLVIRARTLPQVSA